MRPGVTMAVDPRFVGREMRKSVKQQGDLQVQTKEILPAGISKSFIFPWRSFLLLFLLRF
jgi:hypothetical protein